MWSISCKIQHLAQQRGQHKLQCSKLRKTILCHSQQENMANEQGDPEANVFRRMNASAAWRQNGSECWEHCTAHVLKRRFQ